MAMLRTALVALPFLCIGLPWAASAETCNASTTPTVVKLRVAGGCDAETGPDLCLPTEKCCFEGTGQIFSPNNGWAWNHRDVSPNAECPLLVDVGPGKHNRFRCSNGNGWVTLRGAGREQTTLYGQTQIEGCEHLAFENLRFDSASLPTLAWDEGGSATWTNVDIISHPTGGVGGGNISWGDDCKTTGERSVHFFFGSRIHALGAHPQNSADHYPFGSNCSDTWFVGSDLLLDQSFGTPPPDPLPTFAASSEALSLGGISIFRAFGSTIRLEYSASYTTPNNQYSENDVVGVRVFGGSLGLPFTPHNDAEFHMHGGLISVTATTPGISAVALEVGDPSVAHVVNTAFRVIAGPAEGDTSAGIPIRTRVRDFAIYPPGILEAPYLWPAGAKPPLSSGESNVLVSLHGQDLFVETDCDSTGDCSGPETETHMMIYADEECGAVDPWFDTVTGCCRNATSCTGP